TKAYDDMTEVELEEQPLQKYPTSDSLDEYMDECCRLSEVNQGKTNPLGSGLGYLEHICQLIEKIGQLQEHNLKLQRQICSLQKESRTKQSKEEYFRQHCSCGAASLAFQELKRHCRSEFHSLTASSGTLSDLSTILEIARRPDRLGKRGLEGHGETGNNPPVPLLRKGLNRRSYTEGEELYNMASFSMLKSEFPSSEISNRAALIVFKNENHPWGRVKELVKKTRLRNHSRLGLSSNALKRSCPQLYRPDLGSADPPKRDRNSMIALG
uniref:Si:ch211-250c4.4 n=1 Tax=Lepisosteus oculatus TaxID=7918 RepID=W5MT92_LEPOC